MRFPELPGAKASRGTPRPVSQCVAAQVVAGLQTDTCLWRADGGEQRGGIVDDFSDSAINPPDFEQIFRRREEKRSHIAVFSPQPNGPIAPTDDNGHSVIDRRGRAGGRAGNNAECPQHLSRGGRPGIPDAGKSHRGAIAPCDGIGGLHTIPVLPFVPSIRRHEAATDGKAQCDVVTRETWSMPYAVRGRNISSCPVAYQISSSF